MEHTDQRSCMQQCEANPQCSAIEWYEAKWKGSSCFHFNQGFGKNRAVKGATGPQWRDAKCLTRKEAHVTVEEELEEEDEVEELW